MSGECACGQQECVIAHGLTAAEMYRVRAGVDGGDRHAQAEVDVVLGVPGVRCHRDGVLSRFAQEVFLGQRRAEIRVVQFGADEADPAPVAFAAQGAGCGGASQARAGDHDAFDGASDSHDAARFRKCRRLLPAGSKNSNPDNRSRGHGSQGVLR
ncbi:hypothetical protein D9M72_486840 [compost metagenome]